MTAPVNVALIVQSAVLAAQRWPGGQGILSAASPAWSSYTATLQFLLPDGQTYYPTAITAAANGLSAAFVLPAGMIQCSLAGGTPLTLAGVVITGTGGQFSCTANNLAVGNLVAISGTYGGTGSIVGYANPTTYVVTATNGTTTFTLGTVAGAALVTTAGTPTGLTYTLGNINVNAQVIPQTIC